MFGRGCWSRKIEEILKGDEMLSEASLEDDELDLTVLLKQQGLTLILVIFEKDFDDSDDVLDLVISKVWF